MVGDPDDVRFLEILKGARSESEQPDIALAELLIVINTTELSSRQVVLEKLASDARQG